jgi:class 3 adenylate cyclase
MFFTDVEQSTELLRRVGPERYSKIIDEHRVIVRRNVEAHGGREVDARGEEFFTVFARARDAAEAAAAIQCEHESAAWPEGAVRVRIGMHTGAPVAHDGGYLGLDVHRAARICAAGHGGQILLSRETAEVLGSGSPDPASTRSLGEYQLKGLGAAEEIFQLLASGLAESFPPLRVTSTTGEFVGEEHDALAEAAQKAVESRRGHRFHRHEEDRLSALAWEARGRIPTTATEDRERLAQLAAALFDAAGIAADADRFLSSVDRKGLERRIAYYREMAVVSRRAQAEADALDARRTLIASVNAERAALSNLAAGVGDGAATPAAAKVRAKVRDLERALEEARAAVGASDAKLERTRHRGIYRRGPMHIVPEWDEVGIEHHREFASLREALEHRKKLNQESKRRKQKLPGLPHDYADSMQRYMPVRDDKP